jgi:serine/threonine-protein kinase
MSDPVASVAAALAGRYEVQRRLGEGGMATVYLARDLRHGRDVAVKVLKPELAAAIGGERFLAEVRMTARLQHPHILPLFDSGEADGCLFYVMPYVPGESLGQRLERERQLPVADAVQIAIDVAAALDFAHRHGVIHRDIKPANILLHDGKPVVADFGIALAVSGGAERLTGTGLSIGTPLYMSPEQATGDAAIGPTTDVWALGCVLYEMLVGEPPYRGGTPQAILGKILHGEPPSATAARRTVPPHVDAAIRKALEQIPADRFTTAAAFADALRDPAFRYLDERAGAVATSGRPARQAVARRTIVGLSALAGVVTVATVAALWSSIRGNAADASAPRPVRFAIELQPGEELPIDAGLPVPLAISRDGRTVVYAARRPSGSRLYLRRIEDAEARAIPGTEGGSGPFLSPDGQWLGFASGGFLRKVPILGGAPQPIARVSNFLDATWSDDGVIVFHGWSGGLFRVASDGGGTPQALTRLDKRRKEFQHQAPYSLPGGRGLLFAVSQDGPSTVELLELPSGARTRLLEGSDPHYLSNGLLLFTRAGRLYTVPFDLAHLKLAGPERPMADETTVLITHDRGALAASLDGTLVYIPAVSQTSRLVLVDRSGSVRPIDDETHEFGHPRFSPDGTRLVVWANTESDGGELWIYDLARHAHTRLSVRDVGRPVWSHDGKRIAFFQGSDESIHSVPADDSKPPELLVARDSSGPVFPLAWSRDGRSFLYSHPVPETNRDVFALSADGTRAPILATAMDERSAMLSPDGRWIVYAALEPGREEEVYVQRYPGPGERVVVSVGGGREPVWSPSGDEIFYRSIDGNRMLVVPVRTAPTLAIGPARTLFQGIFQTGEFWSNYDVNSKTGEFLMLAADQRAQPRLIVALNTTHSLKRR